MTASVVHHNDHTRVFTRLVVSDDSQRPAEVLYVTCFLNKSALPSSERLARDSQLPVHHDKHRRCVFIESIVTHWEMISLEREARVLVVAAVLRVMQVAHLIRLVGYGWFS